MGVKNKYLSLTITQEDTVSTLATTANGQPAASTGLTVAPLTGAYVLAYLNGVLVGHTSYGNKTGSSYWSNDSGTTALGLSGITLGSKFYWNGSVAGFELESGWSLKFVYEAQA